MAIKKIQLRRDTTANWNNHNPILSDGEFGVEITDATNRKFKLGNGITPWNNLDYSQGEVISPLYLHSIRVIFAQGVVSFDLYSKIINVLPEKSPMFFDLFEENTTGSLSATASGRITHNGEHCPVERINLMKSYNGNWYLSVISLNLVITDLPIFIINDPDNPYYHNQLNLSIESRIRRIY